MKILCGLTFKATAPALTSSSAEIIALNVGLVQFSFVPTKETSRPITWIISQLACKTSFSPGLASKKPSGLMATQTSLSSIPLASPTISSPTRIFPPLTWPLKTLIGGVPKNWATNKLAGLL